MVIRLLFLSRSLDMGGAENQIATLASRLQANEFEVSIATFYSGGVLEDKVKNAGVSLYPGRKKGRWDLLEFGLRLDRIVRELRPNVIQSLMGPPNICAAILKKRYRDTRIAWGIRSSDMDLDLYDYTWRLVANIERRLAGVADVIIVNSKAGRDHAAVIGFPRSKLVVIPNGFDTEKFVPDRTAGAHIRSEWGVGEHQSVIGMVARLDPIKDHETFLRAIARIKHIPDLKFVCVGGGVGEYADRLQRLATELDLADSLIWTGERSDVPAVLNALDINVLCSLSEGMPNAIGEAMASGVSCVVTNVGDCAALVGDTGAVVPSREPDALAAAIEDLLAGDGDATVDRGLLARQRIIDRYSLEAMTEASAKLYRSLAAVSTSGS